MPKAVIGIGLPGSGKTTFLKPFAEKNGYVYISPDDLRLEITGDEASQVDMDKVWDRVHKMCYDALKANQDIVVDATFSKGYERREFITFLRNYGADKIQGVFAAVPLELSDERNNARERVVPRHAMERMYADLSQEKPVVEDGFDIIFDLDEFQQLDRVEKKEVRIKRFDPPKMR